MKKVLILGISGMAGHIVFNFLNDTKKYNIIGTYNSNNYFGNTIKLDITNIKLLDDLIDSFQPDFIINCIGVLIKESKINPEKTVFINSFIPRYLANISLEKKFKLIQISTDCVFSGKKGGYIENSYKDEKSIYGISKSLGEVDDKNNLTIRTSIIGPEIKEYGEGLFHWIMSQKHSVNGYKSNFWSGITTLELAKFIEYELNSNLTGLVHLTNNNKISKYELLNLIVKTFKLDIEISDEKDLVCDKSFLCTREDIIYKIPAYDKMIKDLREYMIRNETLYNKYLLNFKR